MILDYLGRPSVSQGPYKQKRETEESDMKVEAESEQ